MIYLLQSLLTAVLLLLLYVCYHMFIVPRSDPLRKLCGPPVAGLFGSHLGPILDPFRSPKAHKLIVEKYGRSVCIRGLGPWDNRLLTFDPVSLSHVLKHTSIYEKPWQSRRLIESLIGCGMLAAEGQVHKRQRKAISPSFSAQNLRVMVSVGFSKGEELSDKWMDMIAQGNGSAKIDVCHWISRATFDVIGMAGFDYQFNAIQSEENELFTAYKEMFEVAISQGAELRAIVGIYLPIINTVFLDRSTRTVWKCQKVITRVAGHLIQEKKKKIAEGEKSGHQYAGKDILSLLLKSNAAADLPPEQRISDKDILHNINTFMFAGSDTSSLALTWTLLLLARNPSMQSRLRSELLSVAPASKLSALTPDELESLHETVSKLPYLHNVARESLRLIPPVHSSLRVATQDDEIPTSYPVRMRTSTGYVEERRSITIQRGSFVHVPIEGFNQDTGIWGEDAWEFNPDRWDDLPAAVLEQPGLLSNLLTFSGGPRSCVGMRFSMIEIKTFLYALLTRFVFEEAAKIRKVNAVLTRPYVSGKFAEGSQCPLMVKPFVASDD